MKTIKIFIASSKELVAERDYLEIELARKNKLWQQKGVTFHLERWEDLTSKMSQTRSQDEYNKVIREADIFILLVHTKVGIYSEEEFDTALASFKDFGKPDLYTYFKPPLMVATEDRRADLESLWAFQKRLKSLGHFYCTFDDQNDLWSQFNKELDRLLVKSIDDQPKPTVTEIGKQLGSIPIRPDVYLGREGVVEEIYDKLHSGAHSSLLLVNGQGGIGKTTVASTYYHKYLDDYAHVIWLIAERGIKKALLALGLELELRYADHLTEDDRILLVVKALLSLSTPCLLVIDNADNLKDLEESYPVLRQCTGLHLLITSRVRDFEQIEAYPINHLEATKARDLFTTHFNNHDSAEDGLLSQILEAVDYNTLVIELLAKNLNNFNSVLKKAYTLKSLLSDLQDKGVLGMTMSQEVRTDYHRLQPARPEDIILAMYDIGELTEEERSLLSVFAVLPTINIPYERLYDLLPERQGLDTWLLGLAQQGWLEQDETQRSFKCSPVIQEVILAKDQDLLWTHISDLVDGLVRLLHYEVTTGTLTQVSYDVGIILVQYSEQCVRRSTGQISHSLARLCARIGTFFKSHGSLNDALRFYDKCAGIMKVLSQNDPDNISFKNSLAVSYSKLGETCSALGKLEEALKYFRLYKELKQELFEDYPDNLAFKNGLAVSYLKLGETSSALGKLEEALKYFKLYKELKQDLFEEHPDNVDLKYGLAISYSKLGSTFSQKSNLDEALKYFKLDAQLSKELFDDHPDNVAFKNGLAISYEKLGSTFSALGNLDEALKYFMKRSTLAKQLFDDHPDNVAFKNGLAVSYFKLGDFYSDYQPKPKKALDYFNLAHNLWTDLVRDASGYVEYERNLNNVKNTIERLEE